MAHKPKLPLSSSHTPQDSPPTKARPVKGSWQKHRTSSFYKACALFLLISFFGMILWLTGVAAQVYQMFLAETWQKSTQQLPDRLTELYFSDPGAVPTTYAPDQPLKFKVTIHNLERATTVYRYLAYVEGEPARAPKTIVLQEGETRQVDVEVRIKSGAPRAKVVIEFLEQPQKIHFWVEKRP